MVPAMRKILKSLIVLLGSISAVYLQYKFPVIDRWIIIYIWVFLSAWKMGMISGISSTLTSLGLAGIYLIPAENFGLDDVISLFVLSGLGIWISYTMEKQKQDSARVRAKDFLDTLLDNIPLIVFVKDADDLRYQNFNEFGSKLMGISRDELLGKSDFDLFPENAKAFSTADKEVLASGKVKDIPIEEVQTATGKRLLHTRKIPILDNDGKPIYLLGVCEDITDKIIREKKYALELQEEAARRERNRLKERESIVARAISTLSETIDYDETINGIVKAVVPAMGDWAVLSLMNEDGQIRRVAGVHKDKNLQPLLEEFMRDYPPTEADVETYRAITTGIPTLVKSFTDEETMAFPGNKRKNEIYVALGTNSWVIIPVRTRDGILGVLGISRHSSREPFDDLDFALAQEIGRRTGTILDNTILFQSTQKAVRARDEFLSIASHELKTPITSLRLQLEMLMRPGRSGDVTKPIQNAVKQLDRLTLLVNDLLDVGRLESGKMNYHIDVVNIADVVREVTDAMMPQFLATGTVLNVWIEGSPVAFLDRYRMEQVLVNLLNNALKYGLGKPVDVHLSKVNGEVVLTIRDRGVGISQNQIPKIFDKFERGGKVSSIAGLGLGLYITHEIVTAFRGKITVRSSEGEQTEFTVTLPGA
jgi:PAS domain S-box-containing protein